MKTVIRLLALLAGVYVGFRFPDFDQRTDLLMHRSIITHGLLAPLLLYAVLGSRRSPAPARLFVAGVALAVAVHLSYDLFPRAWWRHALIHLPTYGWTPTIFSWVWIALSIVVCFFIALKSAQGWMGTAMVFICSTAVFSYSLPTEHALWQPLVAAIVGIGIAVALASRRTNRDKFQT
tara:strand:+ start:96 stop:629 length:534 start_codon:yes stop_codon:yes gene_type:complete